MANVYLGTDTRLQRRVAIKALRPEVAIDRESRKRFQREAHAVSTMGHPNIVRVYDAGEEFIPAASADVPIPYIVMEYIDGKILRSLMNAGAFDPKVAVHIALGILEALGESHRHGIIHRDIKPGNVMISQSGVVKVCDFGIAQAIEDPTNDPSAIVGTAQYFSPEQAKGEIIDARSDLYATAVVLFEMVTGTPLFTGDTSVAIAFQHVTQTAPRARSRRPELSPELDVVIARGLEKDAQRRFASATEFAAALRSIPALIGPGRAEQPTTAPDPVPIAVESPVTPPERPTSTMDIKDLRPIFESDTPPRATTARWILLAAAGVLVVASVVVGMMYWVLTIGSGPAAQSVAITMPDVTGHTYTDVDKQLKDLGLVVTRRQQSSDTVARGEVISSSPEAGVHLAKGEIVTVVTSSGPARTDIPNISLLTLAQAKKALTKAGFVVGAVTQDFDATSAAGVVVGTTPAAGEQAIAGTTVGIVVSNGLIKVPDVTGMTLAKATGILQGSKLQMTVTVTPDSSCSGQTIGKQSVPPGDAPQHTAIEITYCGGS